MLSFVCACEGAPLKRQEKLDLGDKQVVLAPGARVHEVLVENISETKDFNPSTIRAHAGDVVRFTTADPRTHALAFDEERLPGNARQVFNGRGQLRSPPLVVKGASWIVSLEAAAPGTYRFQCTVHGVWGQIVVER